MSSATRADLESQIAKLRKSFAALRNAKDRFDLELRVKRLEDQLAEMPDPPDERLVPLARAIQAVGMDVKTFGRPPQ